MTSQLLKSHLHYYYNNIIHKDMIKISESTPDREMVTFSHPIKYRQLFQNASHRWSATDQAQYGLV